MTLTGLIVSSVSLTELVVAVSGAAIFGISTYWSIMTLEHANRRNDELAYRILYRARYGLLVLAIGGAVFGLVSLLSGFGAIDSTAIELLGELCGIGGVLVFTHELYIGSKHLNNSSQREVPP